MTVSVIVSRTMLGLEPLELEASIFGFEIVELGPGARTMKLKRAVSPVSDGNVLVGATADAGIARLRVRCFGEEVATVFSKVAEVEAAFNQWSYTMTVTIEGAVEVWRCQPANHARGVAGTYDAGRLLVGHMQDVTLDIPRQPIGYAYSVEGS
jgi:hypothetical protein